jgi:pantoate--beta-alanine ligase
MGNLHEGHLSLMRLAKRHGDPVVASILLIVCNSVRTKISTNIRALCRLTLKSWKKKACTFCSRRQKRSVSGTAGVPCPAADDLGNILEGEFRPGFFGGVTTVVLKLFSCVQPRVAVFGKKIISS